MKKISILLLCVALSAALLAGCTRGDGVPVDAGDPAGALDDAEAPEGGSEPPDSEPDPADERPATLPGTQWETGTPESRGMDGALLQSMHAALDQTGIYAVITVKDGVLVDEYYKEEYNADSVFRLNSCSKSFTSALVGIAIGEGYISGVDVTLDEYFPQLVGTEKGDIPIRYLLEHTSGIEWYEWGGNATSFWGMNTADNWVDFVLEQPMAATPGTTFNYTTGGPHLLAAILQQATGKTVYEYGREHIFDPLDMASVHWREDPQGVIDGGNGIEMTARDAAKFGQLFLGGGSWAGEQLVPADWVELSTTRQSAGSGRSGVYGYQWWIRPFGAGNYDTYYAMGHAGQFIFVVPELDLVTVVTSPMEQDTYLPWTYFTDYILASCG